jgi:hypothetical protein
MCLCSTNAAMQAVLRNQWSHDLFSTSPCLQVQALLLLPAPLVAGGLAVHLRAIYGALQFEGIAPSLTFTFAWALVNLVVPHLLLQYVKTNSAAQQLPADAHRRPEQGAPSQEAAGDSSASSASTKGLSSSAASSIASQEGAGEGCPAHDNNTSNTRSGTTRAQTAQLQRQHQHRGRAADHLTQHLIPSRGASLQQLRHVCQSPPGPRPYQSCLSHTKVCVCVCSRSCHIGCPEDLYLTGWGTGLTDHCIVPSHAHCTSQLAEISCVTDRQSSSTIGHTCLLTHHLL